MANDFKEFAVRSVRRLTDDANHNAFTGTVWFQDALYVTHRQGDRHIDQQGRVIVLRSRDEGVTFDKVAVLRGEFDTRDPHLYTDGNRLYVSAIEDSPDWEFYSGVAWSDDGLHWTGWNRVEGADGYVMWRPQVFDGRFYCAGFRFHGIIETPGKPNFETEETDVAWFESADGLQWEKQCIIHEGEDLPNESYFDFYPDGSIAMIMRRGLESRKPLLLRSVPPYENWDKVELDVALHGPALWLVGEDIWISGRWYLSPHVTHVAIFKIVDNTPQLQLVLPSGYGGEIAYMGVARHPLNKRRFHLSYYSCHMSPADPAVCQWDHPDIYLVDISFTAEYLSEWEVSDLIVDGTHQNTTVEQATGWRPLQAYGEEMVHQTFFPYGFVEATPIIDKRDGVIFFRKDVEVGPIDAGLLHLGYDGNVVVRLNGGIVHEASGTNPAHSDEVTIPVAFRHGTNHLEIAMETNGGKACGIFARYEAT